MDLENPVELTSCLVRHIQYFLEDCHLEFSVRITGHLCLDVGDDRYVNFFISEKMFRLKDDSVQINSESHPITKPNESQVSNSKRKENISEGIFSSIINSNSNSMTQNAQTCTPVNEISTTKTFESNASIKNVEDCESNDKLCEIITEKCGFANQENGIQAPQHIEDDDNDMSNYDQEPNDIDIQIDFPIITENDDEPDVLYPGPIDYAADATLSPLKQTKPEKNLVKLKTQEKRLASNLETSLRFQRSRKPLDEKLFDRDLKQALQMSLSETNGREESTSSTQDSETYHNESSSPGQSSQFECSLVLKRIDEMEMEPNHEKLLTEIKTEPTIDWLNLSNEVQTCITDETKRLTTAAHTNDIKPSIKTKYRQRRGPHSSGPHKCCYCELSFKVKKSRIRHEREIHLRDCPFFCQFCNRNFLYQAEHQRHELGCRYKGIQKYPKKKVFKYKGDLKFQLSKQLHKGKSHNKSNLNQPLEQNQTANTRSRWSFKKVISSG